MKHRDPRADPQRILEEPCGSGMGLGESVPVDLEGDIDSRMAEPFRDRLGVEARLEPERSPV